MRYVVAILLLALTGCSSSQIDDGRVESGIKKWAEENSGPHTRVSVDCPADVAVDPGREFHCIVSDQRGQTMRVTVTIENSDGDVTWVAG